MLCKKNMTLYNAIQFSRNKLFVENVDCHDWNAVHNPIAGDTISHNISNKLIYMYSLHLVI